MTNKMTKKLQFRADFSKIAGLNQTIHHTVSFLQGADERWHAPYIERRTSLSLSGNYKAPPETKETAQAYTSLEEALREVRADRMKQGFEELNLPQRLWTAAGHLVSEGAFCVPRRNASKSEMKAATRAP